MKPTFRRAGRAYFFDYFYTTVTKQFSIDQNMFVEFAPHTVSISPEKFSRLGGALLKFSGQGFYSEETPVSVELRTNSGDPTPCVVINASYRLSDKKF